MSNSNPFAQSAAYYIVTFTLPIVAALQADEYFSDVALSTSIAEIESTPHLWRAEVMYTEKPDEADIKRRLKVLANIYVIDIPRYNIARLENRNWLEAVKQDFPPLKLGRFYIYGSHVTKAPPVATLALRIDAGLAFGSGEHATTTGCLLACERLCKRRDFKKILDVGTGSGILAMGSAKRLPHARVVVADIDPVAVRVARENIRLNHLHRRIRTCVAAGYEAALIHTNAPYDLIFSNILARPLMRLAGDLAGHLAADGVAVLSGLLTSQENMVLAAHREAGLTLHRRITIGPWSTLVVGR